MHITLLIKYFKLVYNNDLCKVKVKVVSRSNPEKFIKSLPFPCIFLLKMDNNVFVGPNIGSFAYYGIILNFKPLKVMRLMLFEN